jgi:hypothetical protein
VEQFLASKGGIATCEDFLEVYKLEIEHLFGQEAYKHTIEVLEKPAKCNTQMEELRQNIVDYKSGASAKQ